MLSDLQTREQCLILLNADLLRNGTIAQVGALMRSLNGCDARIVLFVKDGSLEHSVTSLLQLFAKKVAEDIALPKQDLSRLLVNQVVKCLRPK